MDTGRQLLDLDSSNPLENILIIAYVRPVLKDTTAQVVLVVRRSVLLEQKMNCPINLCCQNVWLVLQEKPVMLERQLV